MKGRIASVVKDLRFSVIREMGLRAADYSGVISLGIGEPDFDTPEEVCRSALHDAVHGATHYTPSQGDPQLLKALSEYLREYFAFEIDPACVVITGGGMGALSAYFRTVLEPQDEVLVPEPHFPAYLAHIRYAGGKVVHVPTPFSNGFIPERPAVEALLTEGSRVLLLNSPNNPTGAVIPGEALDDLARLAVERDLLVVSDEVYDRLLFDGKTHQSIYTRPGMAERTVVIGSFSKTFAMTGWRLGWAFGPPWLMGEMAKVVSYCTSCASSVSQRAALAALKQDRAVVEGMVDEFRLRRNLVYEALRAIPGVKVHKSEGAFYMFPNLEAFTDDTEQFAFDLLDREQVVVVPGAPFGPSGAGCIRIAYTVERDKLAEAMTRFKRFIDGYRK